MTDSQTNLTCLSNDDDNSLSSGNLLSKINSPDDIKKMSIKELEQLANEVRNEILFAVSSNGGHLSSNLGCVELTIALHKVFSIPDEPLIFDVGHQSYTHKLLTGRLESFKLLRKKDGCSGFADPFESKFDTGVSGHAGTAISLATGIASARSKDDKRKVIAMTGDGCLTCGIGWEAINSSASNLKNLLIILNDNKMSISKNIGSISRCLGHLIASRRYNKLKSFIHIAVQNLPFGNKIYYYIKHLAEGIKSALLPPGTPFEQFGIRYLGPVNGHSFKELLPILTKIKELDGPFVLHVETEKGHGVEFARLDPCRYHGIAKCDINTGETPPSSNSFSSFFGNLMVEKAQENPLITAITPAMIPGTGLSQFAEMFPERTFDVGIAEEHAVIFASGQAHAGKKPVCAIYATFFQRALDCLYHDVILANQPVVFVLDRAGVVEDGPTHHGIYDLGFLREMPNLTILAPANFYELKKMFNYSLSIDAPVVIRYPRGTECKASLPEEEIENGKALIVKKGDPNAPVIWAMGPEIDTALEVAQILLEQKQLNCTVINARFIMPFDESLALSFSNQVQISIENHCVIGGLGTTLSIALSKVGSKVISYGWPMEKIPHGDIAWLKKQYLMDAKSIASNIIEKLKL